MFSIIQSSSKQRRNLSSMHTSRSTREVSFGTMTRGLNHYFALDNEMIWRKTYPRQGVPVQPRVIPRDLLRVLNEPKCTKPKAQSIINVRLQFDDGGIICFQDDGTAPSPEDDSDDEIDIFGTRRPTQSLGDEVLPSIEEEDINMEIDSHSDAGSGELVGSSAEIDSVRDLS